MFKKTNKMKNHCQYIYSMIWRWFEFAGCFLLVNILNWVLIFVRNTRTHIYLKG